MRKFSVPCLKSPFFGSGGDSPPGLPPHYDYWLVNRMNSVTSDNGGATGWFGNQDDLENVDIQGSSSLQPYAHADPHDDMIIIDSNHSSTFRFEQEVGIDDSLVPGWISTYSLVESPTDYYNIEGWALKALVGMDEGSGLVWYEMSIATDQSRLIYDGSTVCMLYFYLISAADVTLWGKVRSCVQYNVANGWSSRPMYVCVEFTPS